MAVVCKFGKMGVSMKAIGQMIWLMVRVDLFIVMEMYMRVSGLMIRHMVREPTSTWTVLNTLASG